LILAFALAALLQSPPTVLADGPSRDVIVVVEGKAWRVRTVEVLGPAPTPNPPPEPPQPDPTPEPDRFGIIAKVKAAAEPFAKPLRDKMASGYRSTASQIAAGVFNVGATDDDKVRAVNSGHAENMRALLTEQERKDLTPVGDVIRTTLKDLWDRKVITDIEGVGAYYRDVASGLQGP
jgi:hypothetical protein